MASFLFFGSKEYHLLIDSCCPLNHHDKSFFFSIYRAPNNLKPVIMNFNGRLFTFSLRTPFNVYAYLGSFGKIGIEIYQFHKRIECFNKCFNSSIHRNCFCETVKRLPNRKLVLRLTVPSLIIRRNLNFSAWLLEKNENASKHPIFTNYCDPKSIEKLFGKERKLLAT